MIYHSNKNLQGYKSWFNDNYLSIVKDAKKTPLIIAEMFYLLTRIPVNYFAQSGLYYELFVFKHCVRIKGKPIKASQKDNDRGHYLATKSIYTDKDFLF